ncbi:MAG TPA: TolC family protein, partial [Candidatus Rifleibacterium sp.]|nr:TolC family protein [Candidatus Rifleibacterium sp.]
MHVFLKCTSTKLTKIVRKYSSIIKWRITALRQAELELSWSEYELKAFILNLVASIENQYWEYYLSLKQLEIVRESLELARQQREETNKRIEAGSIAESEEAAAEAEVAL